MPHGEAAQQQLVANRCIQHRTEFGRLVELGEQGLLHPGALERAHHIVDRVALAACVEHQQAVQPWQFEHLEHVLLARIARGQSGGVNQHQFFVRQQAQQIL